MQALRKVGVTVLGWALVILGLAAILLPGPGLLLLLAGLVILSQEYEWARRRVEPIKVRAFEVAASGVRTWPRVAASVLSACTVIVGGVVWWLDPEIPEFWIIGPHLPLGGPATGLGIVLSGIVALALIAYSVKRFRGKSDDEAAAKARVVPEGSQS